MVTHRCQPQFSTLLKDLLVRALPFSKVHSKSRNIARQNNVGTVQQLCYPLLLIFHFFLLVVPWHRALIIAAPMISEAFQAAATARLPSHGIWGQDVVLTRITRLIPFTTATREGDWEGWNCVSFVWG